MSTQEISIDNEPQDVKGWKKDIEKELKSISITFDGELYVKYRTAINYMNQCFTKGYKVSRRNRTALAEHIIKEIDKKFMVYPKDKEGSDETL